jgi:HlyD family secretion protein
MSRHATAAILAGLLILGACHRKEEPLAAVGTLERDRIELRAETDDPIVEIAAREGADLAAGALVLRLDDARLTAQRERLVAQRDQAKARLAELVRGPRHERVTEARALVVGDDNLVEIATRELERIRKLQAEGVVAAQDLDQRRRDYNAAVARRDQDRAALAALENGTTREELDQARQAMAAAQAELADLEVRAARLRVTAPVAGRLDALPFELGERPRAGDVIAILLAAGQPYARVYVPEPLLVAAHQGATAEVTVDGQTRAFRGHVRLLSAEAAFTPHFALTERDRSRLAYLAEIELDEEAARALPTGVPVEARFVGGEAAQAGAASAAAQVTVAPAAESRPVAGAGDDH